MPVNTANPNIKHVFVLMLENRSFDHMLGFLNNNISTGSNSYEGVIYNAEKPALDVMPYDPGHEFNDVLQQLTGDDPSINPYNGGKYPPINNSGFVTNYATTKSKGEGGTTSDFGEIMKCYDTAKQLPVMTALINNFALCDNWFSSLPGPTWPNRFFVHAASSAGLDDSPTTSDLLLWESIYGFSFPNGSIYDMMKKHGKTYRLYRGVSFPLSGCIPGVAALKNIEFWDTRSYDHFEKDLKKIYKYDYTFIEPNYGDIVNNSYSGGQSQHPMDDVRGGEALIKSTYEALRKSPIWEQSMLIITYDEHGGFYDHMAPPPAIAPGDKPPKKYSKHNFTFEQYGVRVPAIVVSAYTAKKIHHTLFDHASVPATLEAMFGMPALTNRDANANNVTALVSLPKARTDTPMKLPKVAPLPPKAALAMRAARAIVNEQLETVDTGNLPFFLNIIHKAELERANRSSPARAFSAKAAAHTIVTKAQAREYLNNVLPGLLTEEAEEIPVTPAPKKVMRKNAATKKGSSKKSISKKNSQQESGEEEEIRNKK